MRANPNPSLCVQTPRSTSQLNLNTFSVGQTQGLSSLKAEDVGLGANAFINRAGQQNLAWAWYALKSNMRESLFQTQETTAHSRNDCKHKKQEPYTHGGYLPNSYLTPTSTYTYLTPT
eukprot:3249484-Rhodomonas_salina.2